MLKHGTGVREAMVGRRHKTEDLRLLNLLEGPSEAAMYH